MSDEGRFLYFTMFVCFYIRRLWVRPCPSVDPFSHSGPGSETHVRTSRPGSLVSTFDNGGQKKTDSPIPSTHSPSDLSMFGVGSGLLNHDFPTQTSPDQPRSVRTSNLWWVRDSPDFQSCPWTQVRCRDVERTIRGKFFGDEEKFEIEGAHI